MKKWIHTVLSFLAGYFVTKGILYGIGTASAIAMYFALRPVLRILLWTAGGLLGLYLILSIIGFVIEVFSK